MHVLTKIFIVLVALLAVLLTPLVVVYAHNENSYQARYQDSEAQTAAIRAAYESAQVSHAATERRKEQEVQDLEGANLELRRQVDGQETEVRELATRLAEAEAMDAEIRARLSTLASAVDAGQKLSESLIDELRGLRREALVSERQKVQLDEALREHQAMLDAAIEARKALQEELQRLKDEHAGALEKIHAYIQEYGDLDVVAVGSILPEIRIDRNVDASIISVRRNPDQVLAEIDAGSRDGVKVGWVMTIGDQGSFIARLRIITVDINRSTGIVELENESARGRVEQNQHVYARVR